MKITEKETILGTKITYSEGKCKFVLLKNDKNVECIGLSHKDAPLLAPVAVPGPHFEAVDWNFSKITILDDNDFDLFLENTQEMRNFVKKLKSKVAL